MALLSGGAVLVWMARIPDPPIRTVRLRSGAAVEFLDYGIPREPPPTWHLDYRTRISMRDREKLAAEAAALWPDVQIQAEDAGYSRVFLIPTNFSRRIVLDGWKPVIFSHESTAFCFQRSSDVWKRTHGWPPEFRQE